MENKVSLTTTNELFSACVHIESEIERLRNEYQSACDKLYDKLHKCLSLILAKLNREDEPLFLLMLEDAPYGVNAVCLSAEDDLIWFYEKERRPNDDEIAVEVYHELVSYIKENYDK